MYSEDAKYYDYINSNLQYEDIDLYVDLVREYKPLSVCELACGTGRILSNLKQYVDKCVGIDISDDMLKIARSKFPKIDFIQGDMCKPYKYGSFDLIICGYNSLQHILDRKEINCFFDLVSLNLSDNGRLIIDIFNPNDKYLYPEGNVRNLCSFQDEDGAIIDVVEKTKYNIETKNNKIDYIYSKNNIYMFSETYVMHQYDANELDIMLRTSGYKIVQKYGNYDKDPFIGESEKQIVIAKAVSTKQYKTEE